MAGGRRAEIDGRRMKTIFDAINDFGRVPDKPGWNRPGLSAEDIAVRRWFAARMQGEGLRVSMDGAANVSGRLGPEGAPCVMLGSHLDTVPSGGAFDGALGATHALEIPFVWNTTRGWELVFGSEPPPNLADEMHNAWINFVRTGDPNHDGIDDWPRYDADRRATMRFDAVTKVVNDPGARTHRVWRR